MLHHPQQLKKFFLMSGVTLIVCALSLFNSAYAETAYDGFYLGLFGGVAYTPSFSDENIGGTGLSGTVTYVHPFTGTPYSAGLNLGYKYGPFRYEVEGFFMHSNYKSFSPRTENIVITTNFGGKTQAYGGIANIIYDFDQCGNSGYFYLGLGAGYANIKNHLTTLTLDISDSTSAFAMQGIIGYAYNISSSLSFNLDYRYFTTLSSIEMTDERYQNHLFNLGFNYFFG